MPERYIPAASKLRVMLNAEEIGNA